MTKSFWAFSAGFFVAFALSQSASAGPRECAHLFSFETSISHETNRNGHVALEDYKQTNDRTFYSYKTHLGHVFKNRFPVKSWLDSGAGYGLATLGAIAGGHVQRAVAINAQDGLEPLRSRNYEWFRGNMKNFRTGRLVSFLGQETIDAQMTDPEEGVWKPDAIEALVNAGASRLYEFEQSGQFRYVVGFAEDVLPTLHGKFELITDPFGAYFYSAERAKLLQFYYEKLDENGLAVVIYWARDVIVWKLDELTGQPEMKLSEYGPNNFVRRRNGRLQRFEDYLVEKFPMVFSLAATESIDARPKSLHKLLLMKRDPRIRSIQLDKLLAIDKIEFGEESIQTQIPSVTYLEL